ncbi:MAG: YfiR family protein [Caulobacteraceae bacterium]
MLSQGAALALVGLAFAPAALGAERVEGAQSQLMAAIVLNFARFADWPPARFTTPSAPIVLCADNADPFTASLSTLDGQIVGARRLVVKRMAMEDFGAECHLAFVGPNRASPARLGVLEQQGVLVVGEGDDFAKSGAIALVRVGREIRFEVNDGAARRSGVKLSSKLLRLALTVR